MQKRGQELYLDQKTAVQLHQEHKAILDYIAEQNKIGIAPSEPLMRSKLGYGKHQMERYMKYLRNELHIIEPEDRRNGNLRVFGGVGSGRGYKISGDFEKFNITFSE